MPQNKNNPKSDVEFVGATLPPGTLVRMNDDLYTPRRCQNGRILSVTPWKAMDGALLYDVEFISNEICWGGQPVAKREVVTCRRGWFSLV